MSESTRPILGRRDVPVGVLLDLATSWSGTKYRSGNRGLPADLYPRYRDVIQVS